jgi:predicted DNA-binding transcriptional regulator AlpA
MRAVEAIQPRVNQSPQYIDERALSRMIGIAVRTLQRWRLTGRGPRYRRIGGDAVRYSVADVEAWLAQQPAGGEAA